MNETQINNDMNAINTANGNEPAFPFDYDGFPYGGLTKREYFAGLVMQGELASQSSDTDDSVGFYAPNEGNAVLCARKAVMFADALIAELNK